MINPPSQFQADYRNETLIALSFSAQCFAIGVGLITSNSDIFLTEESIEG